jgi:hypothetical protein
MIGFDAAQDCTPILANAKASGVSWVGRYLSFNSSKNLSRPEAEAIRAAGIDIVSIWEARGDLFRTFTKENATREGNEALALAEEVGQPRHTAIYFAVDFDATQQQIEAGVIPYFLEINARLYGQYKVGAYGSGLVLSRLDAEGLIEFDWLAGAMGWQGSQAYKNAHMQEIAQGRDSDPWGFGFPIDTDEAADGTDFGSWYGGVAPPVSVLDVIEQILAYGDFRAGVEMYQRPRGLLPDGRIGPITLRAIGEDMRRR